MKSGGFNEPAHRVTYRTPTGINIGFGAFVVVVACLVASAVPVTDGFARIAVVAAALAAFAYVARDPLATASIVVVSWLVFDGFLVNRFGELSWDGWPDLYRTIGLLMGAVLGLTMGLLHRRSASRGSRRVVVIPMQARSEEETPDA
jgi:hypothetical protein